MQFYLLCAIITTVVEYINLLDFGGLKEDIMKGELFNPDELQAIASSAIGLRRDEACDKIISELKSKYPRHIRDDLPWIFNNAGGAMGQMKILHVSFSEYLILFGTPIGTEGHSGRYAAGVWDFVFDGEMWCYHEGELCRTAYKPGDVAYLDRKRTKGYRIQDSAFMLEYARGRIVNMLKFGLADTIFSTVDSKTFWRTIGISGKFILSEFFKGKI